MQIRTIIFLFTIITGLLGTWQVYRFAQKGKMLNSIKNCYINASQEIKDEFCNLKKTNAKLQKDPIFLFRDYDHTYALLILNIKGKNILLNVGYFENQNLALVKKLIKSIDDFSFDALTLPIKKRGYLLIKNDLKNKMFYSIDIVQINKEFDLNLSKMILYSSSNSIIDRSNNLIMPNPKPVIRQNIHIGYCAMWYCICAFGMFILLKDCAFVKKPKK
jgi:cytochrome oxidase assembly protein ShyY1